MGLLSGSSKYKTIIIGCFMGLAMGWVAMMAQSPPCASADATCPVGSTSLFSGNIGVQGGTAYTATFDLASTTADIIIKFPDASDTLVARDTTDTLTNKTLTAPKINTSVVLKTTGHDVTIDWDNPAQARTYTFPDSDYPTSGIVLTNATQTLTNKTISGGSHTFDGLQVNGNISATGNLTLTGLASSVSAYSLSIDRVELEEDGFLRWGGLGSTPVIQDVTTASDYFQFNIPTDKRYIFGINDVTQLSLNKDGNLMLSNQHTQADYNWWSGNSAFQIGSSGALYSGTGDAGTQSMIMSVNLVQRSVGDWAMHDGYGAQIDLQAGKLTFRNTDSVTAGSQFSVSTQFQIGTSGSVDMFDNNLYNTGHANSQWKNGDMIVAGSTNTSLALRKEDAGTGSLKFLNGAVEEWRIWNGNTEAWLGFSSDGGGTNKMVILDGGNVGIGINDPDHLLEVTNDGGGSLLKLERTGANAFGNDGTASFNIGGADPAFNMVVAGTSGDFTIATGGSEQLRLDNTGTLYLKDNSLYDVGHAESRWIGGIITVGNSGNQAQIQLIGSSTDTSYPVAVLADGNDMYLTAGGASNNPKGIHIDDDGMIRMKSNVALQNNSLYDVGHGDSLWSSTGLTVGGTYGWTIGNPTNEQRISHIVDGWSTGVDVFSFLTDTNSWASIHVANIQANGDVLPNDNYNSGSPDDLGSPSKIWQFVHGSQFHTAEFEIADHSNSYLNIMSGHSTNSGMVFQTSGNANKLGYILGQHSSGGGLDMLGFLDDTGNWAFNVITEAGTGDDYAGKTAVFYGNARPDADAGSNLGSATKRWLGVYSSRVFNADGNAGAPSYTFANDTNSGMYRRTTDTLSFSSGGTYRAEFASGGDLHIGTTGAVINNSSMVHIKAPTSYMGLTVWSQSSGWTALGVRNSSSGCTQSNNTECYAVAFYDSGSNLIGSIRIDDVTDSVRYLTTSDYRLKENETALTGALDNILALKPYTYNYISDSNNTPVSGFFAHEVADYIPQAISGVKDEVWGSDGPFEAGTAKYQQIDYGKMVPMLVGAIQELEERVAELEDGQGN